MGDNRRTGERFHWSAYCHIFEDKIYNRTPLRAKTLDISRGGVKIRYIGEPLNQRDMINLYIPNLDVRSTARVVWSKAVNEMDSLMGMELMEPMPKQVFIGKQLLRA